MTMHQNPREPVLWHERRHAQGLTEYLLILALIAVLSITTVSAFGSTIHKIFGGSTEKVAQLKLKLKG